MNRKFLRLEGKRERKHGQRSFLKPTLTFGSPGHTSYERHDDMTTVGAYGMIYILGLTDYHKK